MTLTILDVEQGTPEWHDARRGIVTASVIGQLITAKTLTTALNDTVRSLSYQLVAERITGHTEPTYPSRAMERGTFDEPYARDHYSDHYASVTECGFMVREINGHRIGYSPDGLVGDDGLIEVKSRSPKAQLATILTNEVPLENMGQIMAGLLVSGREWCDYLSWCGGLPMWRIRVYPDNRWFAAIVNATERFETRAADIIAKYNAATHGLPATERVEPLEEMRI